MLFMWEGLLSVFIIMVSDSAGVLLQQCDDSYFSLECTNTTLSQPFAIENIREVETIFIYNSHVLNINKSDFQWFTSLNSLTINNSYLINVRNDIFVELKKLTLLSIQNSHLEQLLFSFPHNINELDVSFNKIYHITSSAFNELSHLETLKISGNRLTRVGSSTFTLPSAVKTLYLDHNDIEDIDSDAFTNCTGLVELSLSYNRLFYLPIDIFRSLKKLKILRLENNAFSKLQTGLFSPLTSLEYLSLSGNRIEHAMDTLRIDTLKEVEVDVPVSESIANTIGVNGILHCVMNYDSCSFKLPKLVGNLWVNLTNEIISNSEVFGDGSQNDSHNIYCGNLNEIFRDKGDRKYYFNLIVFVIALNIVMQLLFMCIYMLFNRNNTSLKNQEHNFENDLLETSVVQQETSGNVDFEDSLSTNHYHEIVDLSPENDVSNQISNRIYENNHFQSTSHYCNYNFPDSVARSSAVLKNPKRHSNNSDLLNRLSKTQNDCVLSVPKYSIISVSNNYPFSFSGGKSPPFTNSHSPNIPVNPDIISSAYDNETLEFTEENGGRIERIIRSASDLGRTSKRHQNKIYQRLKLMDSLENSENEFQKVFRLLEQSKTALNGDGTEEVKSTNDASEAKSEFSKLSETLVTHNTSPPTKLSPNRLSTPLSGRSNVLNPSASTVRRIPNRKRGLGPEVKRLLVNLEKKLRFSHPSSSRNIHRETSQEETRNRNRVSFLPEAMPIIIVQKDTNYINDTVSTSRAENQGRE